MSESTGHFRRARGQSPRALKAAPQAAPPPFERFYEDHQAAVLGELRRLLGPQAAEDAYQETFLRALRAYDRLRHADHLRAWALTIARRVAADQHRRRDAEPEAPEPSLDTRPAYPDPERAPMPSRRRSERLARRLRRRPRTEGAAAQARRRA